MITMQGRSSSGAGEAGPERWLRLGALLAAVAVGSLGLYVLVVGWFFDVSFALYVIPGSTAMKANSAVGLVFAGLALVAAERSASAVSRRVAYACGVAVVLIGASALIQYAVDFDLGIAELLVNDTVYAHEKAAPGLMAVSSAACFVLLGAALMLRLRLAVTRWWAWQVPALIAATLGFMSVLGYAYAHDAFLAWSDVVRMAEPTAIAFVLLGGAVVLGGPLAGPIRVLVSTGPGGVFTRRFLPAFLVAVPVVGWLGVRGEELGLYEFGIDAVLFALVVMYGFGSLVIGIAASLDRTEALRRRGEEESLNAAIEMLATVVEMRDPYTAGHGRDVARLAVAIATELGLEPAEATYIKLAATVHDIGKMGVPTDLLVLPRRLTPTEFELVKDHPQLGCDLLRGTRFPSRELAEMVLQHHERLDGSGYPAGLTGADIGTGARIIAVSDVVSAMTSHRPYRAALGIDASLGEIKEHRGVLYDPDVVDACLRLFREQRFAFPERLDRPA